MAEKIKRTHAERDALLSKVFDSTLQTKDIEITEAGTTEITPDEGFFALKKVNLNVNVQGGGGSSFRYLDVTKFSKTLLTSALPYVSTLVVKLGDISAVVTTFELSDIDSSAEIVAISINMQTKVRNEITELVTMSYDEMLNRVVGGKTIWEQMFIANGAVEITKEEFYAL
jgi:hypothetical protein